MTITFEVPADWEAELQKAARRQGKDVMAFLRDSIRQQLRPDILPESEVKLLEIINTPLPVAARQRRDALMATQDTRPLTDQEQQELVEAFDAVELTNAHRWQAIAELMAPSGNGGPQNHRFQQS